VADWWGHGGDGVMAAGPHVRGRKGEGEGNRWERPLIKQRHRPVPHGSEGREGEGKRQPDGLPSWRWEIGEGSGSPERVTPARLSHDAGGEVVDGA